MSAGIFTPNFRFKLVEKTSSEVGDGKPHCMLATREQLAEVMYRVRDAQWVSGTAGRNAINIDDGVAFTSDVTLTSASPPTEKVEWELQSGYENAAYTRRAYVTVSNDATPDMPMDAYGASLFSSATYLTVGGINGGSTHDLSYREAVLEYAMWANGFPLDDAHQAGYYEVGEEVGFTAPNDQFRTGLSFFGASIMDSGSPLDPTIYAPYSASGYDAEFVGYTEVKIAFSGEVAWVDDDGSGNPFSSGNRLFIGVEFSIIDPLQDVTIAGAFTGLAAFSTNEAILDVPTSTAYDFKLKLSGADNYITAPIYYAASSHSTNEYRFESVGLTDWIFKATDWWPYSKNSPSAPVWNSTTGAKL